MTIRKQTARKNAPESPTKQEERLHRLQEQVKQQEGNDIRRFQRQGKLVIPKMEFRRVVREIMLANHQKNAIGIQSIAVDALQESAESFLTFMFENANLSAAIARRDTTLSSDMEFLRRIRGESSIKKEEE